ncbi:YdcF family protein [Primorskyibacter sp. 2E107]|uniref:YdcF family protein n=1 Tax=Primorskyibacter sp. 2E107 TaxID=3403458 RepID=UPI003AF7A546
MHDDPRPIALILGAAVWPGGQPSPTLRRRAGHGAQLWCDGTVRAVIACGGTGQHPPSEAEAISIICQGLGVPLSAIHLEDRSTTTEQNLRLALPILDALGARDVIIVTDRYHAPRARLMARRVGLTARTDCPPIPKRRRLKILRQTLREIPACLWYWLFRR